MLFGWTMHIPAAGGRRRRRKITTFSGFWDPTKSYISNSIQLFSARNKPHVSKHNAIHF
jgi:hypothetical protein